MPKFPRYGFPFQYYRPYNYRPRTPITPPVPPPEEVTPPPPASKPQKPPDSVWFDLFGIKLYFDDILLICLIFFLYNEGVQDQYLFIALILLLLS